MNFFLHNFVFDQFDRGEFPLENLLFVRNIDLENMNLGSMIMNELEMIFQSFCENFFLFLRGKIIENSIISRTPKIGQMHSLRTGQITNYIIFLNMSKAQ